jgi:hypothetical protein
MNVPTNIDYLPGYMMQENHDVAVMLHRVLRIPVSNVIRRLSGAIAPLFGLVDNFLVGPT